MSDFDDYLAAPSNGIASSVDFSDIAAVLSRIRALGGERHPVRINLTTTDMRAMLARWAAMPSVKASREVPSTPGVASIWGLPIFYGERSEIVYSDGTTEPLTASPSPT